MTEDEKRQLFIAETIVSSEAFMWLMAGANHAESHLSALRPAYREWVSLSGGWARARRPLPGRRLLDDEDDD